MAEAEDGPPTSPGPGQHHRRDRGDGDAGRQGSGHTAGKGAALGDRLLADSGQQVRVEGAGRET